MRELVAAVRSHLEKGFPDVWVEGEISNYRPAESGHLYLTLKDGDSQLRVVMFRAQARLLRFRPQNGMQVITRGRITMYEARGEMQLLAEYMEPMGAGALQVAFEQLKANLAAEGLFAQERKKPLPALPRRIGVITSPRGAVIQRHSQRAGPPPPFAERADLSGPGAGSGRRRRGRRRDSLLQRAERGRRTTAVDVILIARGGGSVEDLAAFNDESLARAIAASRIPVISAVGHETDFTISDFVADLRAPTPSAAAELVVRSKQDLEDQVATVRERLRRAMQYKLLYQRQALASLGGRGAFVRMADAIARRQQRLDDLAFRLEQLVRARVGSASRRLDLGVAGLRQRDLRQQLKMRKRELDSRLQALAAGGRQSLLRRRSRLEQAVGTLAALSPVAILERGYSLIFDTRGALVKDAAQLAPGDAIAVQLARGGLDARVETLRHDEPGAGKT